MQKRFYSAYKASNSMDNFHIAVCLLHGLGAIGATIMSLVCDTAKANQRAMTPTSIPWVIHNASTALWDEAGAFRAAFPWSEDAVFTTHVWNPYMLIMAFEWITTAFALCMLSNLKVHRLMEWILGWLALGTIFSAIWFGTNSRRGTEFCTAMFVTLILSYIATAALCVIHFQWKSGKHKPQKSEGGAPEKPQSEDPVTDHNDDHEEDQAQGTDTDKATQEQPLMPTSNKLVISGRVW